jgi:hypothetical protein
MLTYIPTDKFYWLQIHTHLLDFEWYWKNKGTPQNQSSVPQKTQAIIGVSPTRNFFIRTTTKLYQINKDSVFINI